MYIIKWDSAYYRNRNLNMEKKSLPKDDKLIALIKDLLSMAKICYTFWKLNDEEERINWFFFFFLKLFSTYFFLFHSPEI